MSYRAWVGALLVTGCVSSSTIDCPDGSICPVGTVCATVAVSGLPQDLCVLASQLESCRDQPDRTQCSALQVAATCHDGVCLADACGNGLLDSAEVCDDGNTSSGLDYGDGCSSDCASTQVCGNAIKDPINGEECDLADAIGHDGCSSSCKLEGPGWVALAPMVRRQNAAMSYDPKRHRVVLFGGFTTGVAMSGEIDDTWEWDGRRWYRPLTALKPLGRSQHAMAYDGEQTIMFGGAIGETWGWGGSGWSLLHPAHAPSTRSETAMAYDAAHHEVVLFGGVNAGELSDAAGPARTWIWDFRHGGDGGYWDWTLSPATGPAARRSPAMSYDPVRGVVLMFGGFDSNSIDLGDLWEFNGLEWKPRPFSSGPAPYGGGSMAFDPIRQRTLLVRGCEAWEWDDVTWTRLPDPGTCFSGESIAADPISGRVIVLGVGNDWYQWDGTSWSSSAPRQPLTARHSFAVAADPGRREVVVFGGNAAPRAPTSSLGDTWIWDEGTWRTVGGTAPPARHGASMAYDAVRKNIVLFGGVDDSGVVRADTWIWNGTTWAPVTPSMSPQARRDHAMTWDGVRQRVILVGGRVTTGAGITTAVFGDTWSWTGTTWTRDATTGPLPRAAAAIGYDPIRQRVVLFGGTDATNMLSDTWTWDGQAWTAVAGGPSERADAKLAWDAARQRLVLVGGQAGQLTPSVLPGLPMPDVWEWDGGAWSIVPTMNAPPTRGYQGVVPDMHGAGIMMIGGLVPNPPAPMTVLGEAWRLRWDGAGIPEEACTSADTDGDGLVACADPDCWQTCTPTCPIGATSCAPLAKCGDQVCDPLLERCDSCPEDCGPCVARCGDLECNGGETLASCPGDNCH